MGITEYVRPTHTFSILICSFDSETAPVARRIHHALRQSSGLYTSASAPDALYNVVARQYDALLHVALKSTPDPAAVITGWNRTLVVPVQRAFGSPDVVAPRRSDGDPDVKVLLSARALDEAEIRNDIADAIATALRTGL